MNTQSTIQDHEAGYTTGEIIRHDDRQDRPARHRWLLGIGAAVIVAGATAGALMATSSGSTPVAPTAPASTSAPANPAVPSHPGVPSANPAVPSHPGVPSANPAVPSRPNVNPAVPSQPGVPSANPAVPGTPAQGTSAQVAS
jgi:hypothetical protein